MLARMPLQIRPDQQFLGPWLDRLFPVTLPGGRVCSVTGFEVVPAYRGVMEGGLDPAFNAVARERAVALAEKHFGGPVHVVEPTIEPLPEISKPGRPRERLPWMVCMAALVSKPLDDRGWGSRLTLVWWQDAFTDPLPVVIERAAAGVVWEREARGTGEL